MKYCGNCGAQINDESQKFCLHCGAAMQGMSGEGGQRDVARMPIEQRFPMKWFKFLIGFALFFGAFINVMMGFNYILGTIYDAQSNGQVTAEIVYGTFGAPLKALDVIYGIMLLGIGALSIVARFKLAKFRHDGPGFLYLTSIVGMVMQVIYFIGIACIASGVTNFSSLIIGLTVSGIMLYANVWYFTKRAHMFCK